MSIGKYLSVASLACVLPLVGCDESESNHDQDVQADGAVVSSGNTDAGVAFGDGSVVPGTDAGQPSSHTGDAGSVSHDPGNPQTGGDAGVPPSTSGSKFFLPTSEPTNTALPRVEVDAKGNTHTVYPAFFDGDAFYTYCEGDCGDSSKLTAVRFETDGTVYNAMIRLTADGKPRVLLSGSKNNYWAECDQGCTERANWKFNLIQTHNGDLEVDGEALALDPQGRPRFLVHAYRALFGIGQKTHETSLAQCDGNCTDPNSWRYDVIASDELWVGSSFQYDATGKAHVATNVYSFADNAGEPRAAYLSCTGACNAENTWNGIGFYSPFESMNEAIDMHPSISLALTKDGRPRIAQIAKTPAGTAEGARAVVYWSCDEQCEGDHWKSGFTLTSDKIDEGIDLALDANDKPRMVFTLSYDIALVSCDAADCSDPSIVWDHIYVERGGDIPSDQIFLEYNCNVGAWFLHSPSLALTSDGKPRVAYQIRDVSGGGATIPDPTKPGCVAGTDMTLTRMAVLTTYKE